MRALAIPLCAAAALLGAAWWYPPTRASAVPAEPALARLPAEPFTAQLESLGAAGARAGRSVAARPASRPSPAALAREAACALCDVSAGAEWEQEARARAAGLDRTELARLASNPDWPTRERLAAAELLRHVPGAELPPAALALLRESWAARDSAPGFAAAAVRALGCFGSPDDRAQLLDVAVQSSGLALAGLACARGDAAARELASLAIETTDAGRSETALALLASIAASEESALSARARAECADALERRFADAREARRLCALTALDPARATR